MGSDRGFVDGINDRVRTAGKSILLKSASSSPAELLPISRP